jgi:hypothetical protein
MGFLQAFSVWAAEPENERRLLNADIYFLRRRVMHVVYFLHELLNERDLAEHRHKLTRRVLSDLFRFLRVAMPGGNSSESERALMQSLVAKVGTI